MKTKQKPAPKFTSLVGVSLEQWRSDIPKLGWAQREPVFLEIVSVVHNESYLALAPVAGVSENRMLGRAEGYQMALEVLRAMAVRIEKPVPQLEPTYEMESNET